MNEISLHILDILQNSIKAGATLITVIIEVDEQHGTMTVRITDNGCGMDEEYVQRVTDPFTTGRTTRRVGLGIPLFKASAEATGGTLSVVSEKGKGTEVTAVFYYTHIDCPPLGNMTDTFVAQVMSHPELDFEYRFVTDKGQMEISTVQMRQILGEDVALNEPSVIGWMRESIEEEMKEIRGGSIL